MKTKKQIPKALRRPSGALELASDAYLITILGIFPLFPGFQGYGNITFAKYAFFLAATGLWLAALAVLRLRDRRAPEPPDSVGWVALALLGVTAASWLCSPWRAKSLLGAGRYDGLVSAALYLLICFCLARHTRPKRRHAAALAAGLGLCCALGVIQLLGGNPLGLFPKGVGYYDTGLLYSGAYLGTIGNTNILDAALALAIPLCAALWITEGNPLWLPPLLPMGFVVLRAGGGGIKAALLGAGLLGLPLLLTERGRVRRALRLLALGCGVAALSFALQTDYPGRRLRLGFSLAGLPLGLLLAAALLLALSLIPWPKREPTPRTRRRCFALLSALLLLGGLTALWFWPGKQGTLWELRQILHGAGEEGFGSSRIRIWRDCLALVPGRWLLGGGPGTLALRLNIHFSRVAPETGALLESYVDNAHNLYLGELVNCGVLGLLGTLALFALALRRGLRRDGLFPAFALALIGGLIHALFGLGLCLSEPLFWSILGLCAAKAKEEPV